MTRIRSPEEAIAAAKSSLATIHALANLYDAGEHNAARDIASVVHRLMTEEFTQTRLRRELKFSSFICSENPRNIIMQYLSSATNVRFQSDGGTPRITITHVPLLDEMTDPVTGPDRLSFNDWWNQAVWIAGAAEGPITPPQDSKQVPFPKRRRLTRRTLVEKYRNTSGAHYQRIIDEDVSLLGEAALGGFDIVLNNGATRYSFLETPEYYNFINTRAQAMVRHIAFEVLNSKDQWSF